MSGIATLVPSAPGYLKAGLDRIARLVEQASAQYQPERPQSIAPLLADGLRATRELIDQVGSGSLPESGKADIQFELRAKENTARDSKPQGGSVKPAQ